MIEIPESATLGSQALNALLHKRVKKVHTASSEHKFCWYYGDPAAYNGLLSGKEIIDAKGHGMYVDIRLDDDCVLSVGDGTIMRYFEPIAKLPEKYQLLVEFDDASALVFTVAMYGGIWAFKGHNDNPYYQGSLNSISPLSDKFNEEYFDSIFRNLKKKDISAKAFLATEQRIPGLGNGSLQDILILAGIHPKRKISTLSDFDKDELFNSVKQTLKDMALHGGRDTEKDLFGNSGGYETILSKNTYRMPCRLCGETIVKEAYLGGSVYYCPNCQKI